MSDESSGLDRLKETYRRGGPFYAAGYSIRWAFQRVLDGLDRRLIAVEQRRGVAEPWAILSKRLTTADNRKMWNEYDWSKDGEEWNRSDSWKADVVREYIDPNIRNDIVIAEIGPGGGKWTEVLQPRARKLYLIDVAEKPLELCRARFASSTNIEYLLSDGRSIPVPSATIDAVWSFDAFVHINPIDIRRYFQEFARVLTPGGVAVVHHAGAYDPTMTYRTGNRSDMTDQMALEFAQESKLQVVTQTKKLVHARDVVTILRKSV